MKKIAAASGVAFLLLAAIFVGAQGAGLTKIESSWLRASMVDSSPIGSVAPSTGAFTTVSASSLMSNGSTVGAAQGGYVLWNITTGTGEMDFVDNQGLGVGGFGWFNTSTGTPGDALMFLDDTGLLTAKIGFHGSLTGNVTGNVTGNLTGNASTASALASTPSNCGQGVNAIGVNANGNAICSTHLTQSALITSVCTTPAQAFASCGNSFTWPSPFGDASYAITCTVATPTPLNSGSALTATYIENRTAAGAEVFIQNGDADAAIALTATEIDCIGVS